MAAIVLCAWCSAVSYGATPPALSGVVSSQEEGQMEGVQVSAKRDGSNVTVSVVSDSQGRYSFPGERLKPGSYHVKMRAVGYDLDDPGTIKIEANKTAKLDLKLQKTKDLASQLTNAEWFLSNPEIKKRLLDDYKYGNNCISCHTLAVVMKSKYKPEDWPKLLTTRMWTYAEASILRTYENPVRLPVKLRDVAPERPHTPELAAYLSSINLSNRPDGTWPFELKTLPRVKGRSTKVIVTEYDLPRKECQPHDAAVAPDGMVWYTDVGNGYLGMFNPRSEQFQEWPIPVPTKPGPHEPPHTFDIKFDKQGNPIVGGSLGIIRFDRKTATFKVWEDVPGGMVAVSPDGIVWSKDQEKFKIYKLDPKTGEHTMFAMLPNNRFYGIEADSKGNFYGASLQQAVIGEMNGKTGEWKLYPTPTPDSGSRRADMDKQDRLWFAEYYVGKIGMFDTNTKQFREWDIPPTPLSGPYDVVADKNGEVWAAGEFTDNVFRLNPGTGQVTTYPIPSLYFQAQRIDVDNSTNPVTVWVGESHRAKLAKVEPLD